MKIVSNNSRNLLCCITIATTILGPTTGHAAKKRGADGDKSSAGYHKKRGHQDSASFPFLAQGHHGKRARTDGGAATPSGSMDGDFSMFRVPLTPDDAALTIQSAFRGYVARKEVRQLKHDSFTEYLQKEAAVLRFFAEEVQKQINLRHHKSTITRTEYIQELDEVQPLVKKLHAVVSEIGHRAARPLPATQELADAHNLLVANELFHLRTELNQFLARYGLNSLTHSLLYHLGENWQHVLSAESAARLESFERYFSVNEAKVFELTDIGGGHYLISTGDDVHESIYSEKLSRGELIVRAISNPEKSSVMETLYGAEFLVPFENASGNGFSVLLVRGTFTQDPLNTIALDPAFAGFHHGLLRELESVPVDARFKQLFFKILPLRDLLIKSGDELRHQLSEDYKSYKALKKKPLQEARALFMAQSTAEQLRTLTLLLMQDKKDLTPVLLLAQANSMSPGYVNVLKQGLHYLVAKNLVSKEDSLGQMKERLDSLLHEDIPIKNLILASDLPDDLKAKAMDRADEAAHSGGTGAKAKGWVNAVLKLPIGKDVKLPVSLSDGHEVVGEFMAGVRRSLDKSAYGHKKAKREIERIAGQWISRQGSAGEVLALEGPPGNGKTSLGKGVAEALGLPFIYLPLGGATDSAFLLGHDYTYMGSNWGKIADAFIKSKSETFVLFIDEIDKVSLTDKGKEISDALTHFLDPEGEIEDKYFETKFSGKKLLIILACNDASLIPAILRDRIRIVSTDPLLKRDKLVIGRKYLLPKILEEVGFAPGEVTIDESALDYLVTKYTHDAGARELKRLLFSIVRELNLKRLTEATQLPMNITKEVVDDCIKKATWEFQTIPAKPLVGTVNGLFATTAGGGGITVIQAFKNPNSHGMLDLELTGSQGDVMQQSMKTARTVAWNLLPKREQAKLTSQKTFGLHLHAPDTSMKKDGPSAGGAITVAIVSRLLNIPIKNDVAMTGEIDLNGNITKIGGLHFKMMGAKRAGVTKVFYPRENQKDVDKIKKVDPELINGINFSVQAVDTIYDLLSGCLVDTSTPFQALNN